MRVVKANLHDNQIEKAIPDNTAEGRQFIITGHSSPSNQWIDSQLEQKTGDKSVEQDSSQRLLVHLPVHLTIKKEDKPVR